MNNETPTIFTSILPIDKSIANIVANVKANSEMDMLPRTSVKKYLEESQTLTQYIYGIGGKRKDNSRNTSPKLKNKGESRMRTGIPWELTPVIYFFLSAKEKCSEIKDLEEKRRKFEKYYFNKVKGVEEKYFSVKRDVNADYQALCTDMTCLEPLINTINSIYVLSRIGNPIKRPTIILTFLKGLDALINEVICKDTKNYDTKSKALSIHEEDDLPFKGLVDSLVAGRTQSGNQDVLNEMASYNKKINLGRRIKGFSSKEIISVAENKFRDYLESTLTTEEQKNAKLFRNSIAGVEKRWKIQEQSIQEIEEMTRKKLKEYVTRVIRNSDSGDIELNLRDIPPEDLLLIDRLKEAQMQILKIALPYAMHWAISYGLNYTTLSIMDQSYCGHLRMMWKRGVQICEDLGIKIWALTPTQDYSDNIRDQDVKNIKGNIVPRLLIEDRNIDSPHLTDKLEKTYIYICDYIGRAYEMHDWKLFYYIDFENDEDEKIKAFCTLYRWLIEAKLSIEVDRAAAKIASEIAAQRNFREWVVQQNEYKKLKDEMYKIFNI